MAYHAKQRILYYKRFKMDIWGILKNTLQFLKRKPNYYLRRYSKVIGLSRYLNKKNTKIYKEQLLYRDYYFSKKEEKQGLKWRGLYVTKKMKMWLPKYWLSTDVVKHIKLKVILLSNLFFKVFKTKLTKKVRKVYSFFSKQWHHQKRKKIYYKSQFIYEVRNKVIRRKIYFTKDQFASLRVARLFFILYNYRQLKRLNKKAKKMDGVFEQNYLLLMECKLASFIYRSSFFAHMFESIAFVQKNNVWVNKKFIPYIYYIIKSMNIVGFRIWYKTYIYWNFFKRLRRRAFMFILPKYMYISVQFLVFILIRVPLKSEIINPISIDMYRISTYAQ